MDRCILVVDDSELTCQQLSQLLDHPGRQILVTGDGTAALELLVEREIALVITELSMPGVGGLDLIREIQHRALPVSVIVMTGQASADSTLSALKLGAYDYLPKPIDAIRLEVAVEQALRDRSLRDEVGNLRREVQERFVSQTPFGSSSLLQSVLSRIARVATSGCNVLITGEPGTGKSLAAEALHHADASRQGPLVTVDCAALPESLLECEFFGHERGALFGADRLRKGRFERADGGTLVLDEVSTLPLGMQARLLRVLQDGTFERVGGSETLHAGCRIVATTSVDLSGAVHAGTFREDLYYRLNVVKLEIPPLRDRTEDIPALAAHLLGRLRDRELPEKALAPETLARLQRYDWPGNVRELEDELEQAVVTTQGPTLLPENLPAQIVSALDEPFSLDFDPDRPLQAITDELTERLERVYLARVLEHHRGRIDRCAAQSGLSRRSISEKLRRYQIDKSTFKPGGRRVRSMPVSVPDITI